MRTKPALIAGIAALVVLVAIGVTVAVTQRDQGGSLVAGRLEEALSILPADIQDATYVDREQVDEEAGADLPKDPSEDALSDYVRRLRNMPVTDLDRYLGPMVEGKAAFSAADLVWGVLVSGGADLGSVYRFRDDLDLDDVAAGLEDAGWKAEKVDDGTHLTIDRTAGDGATGLVDDRYPALALADVTLVPSRHLMVAGLGDHLATSVHETLSGGDSLADQKAVSELVDGSPLAAEIVSPLPCDAALSRMSPAQRAKAGTALDGLGTPRAAAVSVEDDRAVASLSFADSDAASADAKARRDYLAHGSSVVSGQPMTQLVSDVDVTADGSVVRAAFRMRGPAAYRALDFLTRGADGPAACGA